MKMTVNNELFSEKIYRKGRCVGDRKITSNPFDNEKRRTIKGAYVYDSF